MKILNRQSLKWIAMLIMLVDHIFATLLKGRGYFTIYGRMFGRLAFPIFAFQIAQGFKYTKDIKKYMMRLGIFALISEIPFNLLVKGTIFDSTHQNVMFTMLIGLCCLYLIDTYKKSKDTKDLCFALIGVPVLCYLAKFIHTDYNYIGVLTIILFYFTEGRLLESLLGMLVIHGVIYKKSIVPFIVFGRVVNVRIQAFAVLSCFIIYLYNGKKGNLSLWMQYLGYAFYPIHMLVLGILKIL